MYLDVYSYHDGGPAPTTLPNNSQYKCYDGMHNWNQVQPAPYDGMYQFPSVTAIGSDDRQTDRHNCTICIPNPRPPIPYTTGTPMLPAGKYVVEVVVPPGYELVKEEDKNILIGDNYIAPVTQQFGGFGQHLHPARPGRSRLRATTPTIAQNPTNTSGSVRPCPVTRAIPAASRPSGLASAQSRIVPDYISLFPQSKEVAPFAGATRNLCDRKEVTLDDQTSALAKFYRLHLDSRRGATSRALSRMTSLRNSIRSRRSSARNSPAQPADLHQGLDRQRNLPHVYRPVGHLQRPDLLDLGSQPAEPDRAMLPR